MLVLCCSVLISLALAAPGVSRSCYTYCTESQEYEPENEDPLLDCNCADFVDISKGPVSSSSNISLDETGVYFVPAELPPFEELIASHPFFISNPAKLVPRSEIGTDNRIVDDTKDTLNIPKQDTHLEIHERTETISHGSINQRSENSPIYLDLEIEESIDNNERAAIQKGILIDDFVSTEQTLLECLDFQVIHYTRKYGFIKEFQEFWEARNLIAYEHFPDLKIEEMIQKHCSESEAIVQQSLLEIKQSFPKKTPDNSTVQEIEQKGQEIKSITQTNTAVMSEYNGDEQSTLLRISSPLYDNDNNTELSKIYDKISEQSNNELALYKTTYDPTADWPFINLTPSPILNDINITEIYSNPTFEKATESDFDLMTNTADTIIKDVTVAPITAGNNFHRVTDRDAALDLDTMASEDVFHTYTPTEVAEVKTPDEAEMLNNTTYSLPNLTTTSSVKDSLENEITTTETIILDGVTDNDTSQVSVTGAYSHVRKIYAENEFKIPKITTKECQNNIVQSSIDGTEDLPNNDFTKPQGSIFENKNSNSNNINDIMGELYFVFKKEFVPVRFVQTNRGALSLGIDGVTLCDKLDQKGNQKSSLLTTLCDYMNKQALNT